MEVDLDFPYQAEYAKSGRASCRKCKGNIGKDSLRLAVLIQSPSFDGKITHWYHFMCFFAKQKPKSVDDIAHFTSLRWEDQQKIKEKIESSASNGTSSSNSRKSSSKKNQDFSIEYAKSGRATCNGECEGKILKGEIRISKKDYSSDSAKRFGPMPRWHHVDCFVKARDELEYFDSAENLPGFNTLSADDKKMLRQKIAKTEGKRKAEDIPDGPSKKAKSENDEVLRKQSKWLFYYRDQLAKNLKKAEMGELLVHNNYVGISGESNMLDILSDLMTFGIIPKCDVCKDGNFVFKSGIGYMCNGDLSEWTKCRNIVENPQRLPFNVPGEFTEEFAFLKKYQYKSRGSRIFTKRTTQSTSNGSSNGKLQKPLKPLSGLTFVVVGKDFKEGKKGIEKKVEELGGTISSKVTSMIAAVITTPEFLTSQDKKLTKAKLNKIECVPPDFLDEVEVGGAELMIKKKNIASWTDNTEERLKSIREHLPKEKSASKSGSKYEKNAPRSMTVTLKDGTFVDPISGLSETCHVYKTSSKTYSVVLGLVDLASGLNSFYKLQVLESDDKQSWHLFRSWGRIGTTIGNHKIENMDDLQDALSAFNEVYEKKTGNKFSSKEQKKLPGYWYPLELDHGEKSKVKAIKPDLETSKSNLPHPVQELIALIFDVNLMEKTMVEYELDLKKMPLGKLSSRQLEKAYLVLSEALNLLGVNGTKSEEDESNSASSTAPNKALLLDCSNRFYTLVPHDFGLNSPPLLDNEDLIKNKIEMIDSLREIEIAYNLLKADQESSKGLDPIDECYKKLKTDIQVVGRDSEEFDLVNKFVNNTHAPTHTSYNLKVDEIFKVEREGEKKRFKPFKKLNNHQMLWHGSRLTNFVGILSKGLRIAPPEAPATGYMFGKGIYFADMVSKSANYCCTSKNKPTGLLLLCQVALGDMHELKNAKNITKLPAGKHSVKGLGKTCPDPTKTVKLPDGTAVPIGSSTKTDIQSGALLYNEYIVYDIAQVNIKYLVKTTFDYKF